MRNAISIEQSDQKWVSIILMVQCLVKRGRITLSQPLSLVSAYCNLSERVGSEFNACLLQDTSFEHINL